MKSGNLFEQIPSALPKELCETLASNGAVRIERILSKGQSSPKEGWYDQDHHEWVLLLRGGALLRIEGRQELIKLIAGSYLEIPAHQKHRVEWTVPDTETVWLAVHYP
jgi:cupin 2 domain-containing protein